MPNRKQDKGNRDHKADNGTWSAILPTAKEKRHAAKAFMAAVTSFLVTIFYLSLSLVSLKPAFSLL